jgi:hypothetical protein
MATLLNLVPKTPAIFAGDFNAHVPDLFKLLNDTTANSENPEILDFFTAQNNTGRNRFTSQHENNFLVAYDGFLTRGLVHNTTSATVHEQGFMPKFLGKSSVFGESPFSYSAGSFPNIEGGLTESGILIPNNTAYQTMSDHLPVSLHLVAESGTTSILARAARLIFLVFVILMPQLL